MPLPRQAIEEFRAIWLEDYRQELTYEQARDYAERLVEFFQLVYVRSEQSLPPNRPVK